MASEARLNLVITAQDQARSVIEEFAAGIQETFARLQEEMAKAFNMSEIESTIGEAMATIQRDVSEVNIGTALEEQFSTLNQSLQETAKSVQEGFNLMVESATSAGEEMSRAFNMSTVETTVGEAMSAIQRDVSGANLATPLEEQFREMVTVAQESTGEIRNVFNLMDSGFSQLTQAVNETTRSVEEGFTQMAQDATRAADEMNVSMDGMGNSMHNMEQMMAAQMIGEQLTQMGEKGKAAFEESISSASDFEFNMSRVGAVLTTVGKASNSQMSQMAEMALNLGTHSSFSANQIAEGMYTLARQGLDASTIMGDGVNGAINIVNDLAQATDSSMTDTATVITDIVHEYGLSGSSLRDVANIMSGTLHNSSESLTDLYYSMRQVGPVASNMHQSVEDVSTALALLAQHGITGSAAGTAIKNMLLGLNPRTKAAAALMKDLGISAKEGAADSFYQLNGNLKPLPEIIDILNQKFGGMNDKQKEAALAATFTKYGLAGLNTIVGESRDKFVAFQKELKMDDAATIAHKKYDNLHGDFMRLGAATQTMAKAFGDTLAPALRGAVEGVTKIVGWITQLPRPVKEAGLVALGLASALALIAGTIITVGISLAMMTPGLEFLATALGLAEFSIGGVAVALISTLAPIALAVAAVALLGYAGYELYTHWAQVKAWLISTWSAISASAISIWNNIKSFFSSLWSSVSGFFVSSWQKIQNSAVSIWNGIANFFKGIYTSLSNDVHAFIEGYQNGFVQMQTKTETVAAWIGNAIWHMLHDPINWVKDFAHAFVEGYQNGFVKMQTATETFAAWLGNAFYNMVHLPETILHAFENFLTSTWNAIKNGAITAWNAIVNGIVSAFNWMYNHNYYFQDLVDFIRKAWTTITTDAQRAWNAITQFLSTTWTTISSTVQKVWGDVTNFLSNTWNKISQTAQSVWNSVSNFFSDNTKKTTDTVQKSWNDTGNWLQSTWNKITSTGRALWDSFSSAMQAVNMKISSTIRSAWNTISSTLASIWNKIFSTAKSLWNGLSSFLSSLWNSISSTVSHAWDVIVSVMTSKANQAINAVKSVFQSLGSFFSGLYGEAEQWGANLINMMANGIKSAAGAVGNAVKSVASSISSFLGFHSPYQRRALH